MTTITKYSAEHAAAREGLLNAAIAAGKFPESRRSRYAALYDTNPVYAANLIAVMAPGLPPVAGRQSTSSGPPAALAHRSLLSDTERRRIAAAERGDHQVITYINGD